MLTQDEDKELTKLMNNLSYQAFSEEKLLISNEIRNQCKHLARILFKHLRGSREHALAQTKLEECLMHANSALARYELKGKSE